MRIWLELQEVALRFRLLKEEGRVWGMERVTISIICTSSTLNILKYYGFVFS